MRDGILHHKKSGTPATLEGKVVSLADRIAYINHDIDDAIRAGVLHPSDIPQSCNQALGATHGERINSLILDVLQESYGKPQVGMSSFIEARFLELRQFMFEKVYLNPEAKREETKGMHVISELYKYYRDHLSQLPEEFTKNIEEDGKERVAADYIACMTDRYAITDFCRLFVPREWV